MGRSQWEKPACLSLSALTVSSEGRPLSEHSGRVSLALVRESAKRNICFWWWRRPCPWCAWGRSWICACESRPETPARRHVLGSVAFSDPGFLNLGDEVSPILACSLQCPHTTVGRPVFCGAPGRGRKLPCPSPVQVAWGAWPWPSWSLSCVEPEAHTTLGRSLCRVCRGFQELRWPWRLCPGLSLPLFAVTRSLLSVVHGSVEVWTPSEHGGFGPSLPGSL